MTQDLNKRISSIQYNLLNLPQNITFSTGSTIAYTYDAEGRKLNVTYGSPSKTINYSGNMVYENGTLTQILTEGGYVTFSGSTPVHHAYLKDHQGNNRVVINSSGTIEQVNHYYPFGYFFGESTNSSTQRYKYNGKEFDEMHGLHWYDYGARHYDPAIMRFTTMDPMCEKYYHLSPYAYCGNNPVNAIDPNGKEDYEINKDGYVVNITSVWENVKAFFGYGNGKDRIFMQGSEKPILTLPEGTITNLKNEKGITRFEITDKKYAEEVFQAVITNTDVEWAHIRHADRNNSESSLIINNHDDQDVSISAKFANMYKGMGERISLFEHNHPIPKDIKYWNVPTFNMILTVSGRDGLEGDIKTAKKYPGTIFRVYDLHQNRIQYYDGNGIKKTVKWK